MSKFNKKKNFVDHNKLRNLHNQVDCFSYTINFYYVIIFVL